jgi:hypothetical protein
LKLEGRSHRPNSSCTSHATDISGEDFFYHVLEDIEEEVEAGPSHTRQLSPDTPEYTFKKEDEDLTPIHHPLS